MTHTISSPLVIHPQAKRCHCQPAKYRRVGISIVTAGIDRHLNITA